MRFVGHSITIAKQGPAICRPIQALCHESVPVIFRFGPVLRAVRLNQDTARIDAIGQDPWFSLELNRGRLSILQADGARFLQQ